MVGTGLDAAVVRSVSNTLKQVRGNGAYALQSLREMLRYDSAPILLSASEQVLERVHEKRLP